MRMKEAEVSIEQIRYVAKKLKEKKLIRLYQLLILVFFIGLWELSAYLQWIDAFIFSSPSRIFRAFFDMAMSGTIFYHIGITLSETLISFILGTLLGIAIAVILWWNHKIAKTLEPYLVVLNSLPKTALVPIIIVWLGNNMKSIIFTALLVSVIITILNVFNGFMQVDQEKIKLIKTFGGGKMAILKKVIIPANYPTIISTMKVNIGLSLIGVIIGEFFAGRAGLGHLIIYGSQVFKFDWVMMSIIILAFLATILYQFIVLLERKVNRLGE